MDSTTILGVLGCLTAIITFMLPARMLGKILSGSQGRARDQYGSVLYQYHVAIITCILWIWYAYETGDIFLGINIIGLALHVLYLYLFITFTRDCLELRKHGSIVLFELAIVCVLARVALTFEYPIGFVVIVCYFGSFSVALMRLFVSIYWVSFREVFPLYINAGVWTVYGIISSDFLILIANMAGIFQCILMMKTCRVAEAQRQRDVGMGIIPRRAETEEFLVYMLKLSGQIREGINSLVGRFVVLLEYLLSRIQSNRSPQAPRRSGDEETGPDQLEP